jgi:hypothetical protein
MSFSVCEADAGRQRHRPPEWCHRSRNDDSVDYEATTKQL